MDCYYFRKADEILVEGCMNIFSKLMMIATLTSMFGFVFEGILIELSYSFRLVSSLSIVVAFFVVLTSKLKKDLISWGIWVGIAVGCSVSNLNMFINDTTILIGQIATLIVKSIVIFNLHRLNRVKQEEIKELARQLDMHHMEHHTSLKYEDKTF
ncbi:hypothetical protein [Bacillus cereus]|uniref:hypothetical protein n=1 Tax=Bacillus cereus TaxID=1396 RepID=UPI0012900822|nr:hypothetical protein [Bacillus cereus]